jgi:thiamine-phosphate pyrophosphorylase
MATEIFLIAPADAEPARLAETLRDGLARMPAAALLLQRGGQAEHAYKQLVKTALPIAQAAGTAVLVEGDPGLVRLLGADGLHVAGNIDAVAAAIAALKPDQIVGAGGVRSRDDAMAKGELGVDYILFGPLSGAISTTERELAQWWAETMEIPSVLSDPEAGTGRYDAAGCEFIGLGTAVLEPTP